MTTFPETSAAPADEARENPRWITRQEQVELSQLKPWRAARDLTFTWLCIVLTLQAALWAHSIPVYLLAFVLIACFQNALTLWAHEASHYNITRKQKLNDLLGDLFMGGPIGIPVGHYRWHHVPHHRYLNDPEREVNPLAWICIRGTHFLKEIVMTMAGKYGVAAVTRYGSTQPGQEKRPPRTPASLVGFAIFNGLLFAQCAAQGQWWAFFALWIAPVFTLTLMIGNFRTMVEHQPSSDVCEAGLVKLPAITRVVRSNWLERWLIAPVGLHYHHEHHMFFMVPYHRLRDLRRLLVERGYFDSPDIVRGDGYIKTVWRLAMQPGYGIRLLNPFFTPAHEHDAH